MTACPNASSRQNNQCIITSNLHHTKSCNKPPTYLFLLKVAVFAAVATIHVERRLEENLLQSTIQRSTPVRPEGIPCIKTMLVIHSTVHHHDTTQHCNIMMHQTSEGWGTLTHLLVRIQAFPLGYDERVLDQKVTNILH